MSNRVAIRCIFVVYIQRTCNGYLNQKKPKEGFRCIRCIFVVYSLRIWCINSFACVSRCIRCIYFYKYNNTTDHGETYNETAFLSNRRPYFVNNRLCFFQGSNLFCYGTRFSPLSDSYPLVGPKFSLCCLAFKEKHSTTTTTDDVWRSTFHINRTVNVNRFAISLGRDPF